MAPLQLEGLRGKKSTHGIGWEVSVKSQWIERIKRKGTPSAKDCHQSDLIGYGIFSEFALY